MGVTDMDLLLCGHWVNGATISDSHCVSPLDPAQPLCVRKQAGLSQPELSGWMPFLFNQQSPI